MIKFFRKIRYDLIKQSKMSKYFKYAIGEILLVVIGILIALQINNLNEQSKERKVEISILKNIILDLDSDISQLEFIKKHTLSQAGRIKENYQLLLDNKLTSEKLNEFGPQLWSMTNVDYFEVNSRAYDESQSSGKFNLVQTDSLRLKISSYYRFTKVSHRDNDARTYAVTELRPMLYDIWGVKKEFLLMFGINSDVPSFDPNKFRDDERLGKLFIVYNTHNRVQISKWQEFIDAASNLKGIIKNEIKSLED